MFKIDPVISLGHIITLATLVIGFVFALGKLFAKFDDLLEAVSGLREEFNGHKKEDILAFLDLKEDIHEARIELRERLAKNAESLKSWIGGRPN